MNHTLRQRLNCVGKSWPSLAAVRPFLQQFCSSVSPSLPTYSTSNPGNSTIYSLSSGQGKAGVAVVRVSGPQAGEAIRRLGRTNSLPVARRATLRRFYDPVTDEQIDRGLVLWFPGPQSFTGEDCAELHSHGGLAVISAMLSALGKLDGFRPAEAGEFTKRAFVNQKLDLTEVEGLADVVHAETEAQRKLALRQMEGDLSKLYTGWRKSLIKCIANVEAFIDFSEDENIEDGVMDEVEQKVAELIESIQTHLSDSRCGERLRNGVHVAIIGRPNVGKSSLLNAICQRPAAIVSPLAGTTRDVVEVGLNIGGFPVLLSDTAGLRHTTDPVEREGVRRAMQRAKDADIKIVLVESVSSHTMKHRSLSQYVQEHLRELGFYEDEPLDTADESQAVRDHRTNVSKFGCKQTNDLATELNILVLNKCDLIEHQECKVLEEMFSGSDSLPAHVVSCSTGEGIDMFLETLLAQVKTMCGNPLAGNPSLTQTRHRTHLNNCLSHLHRHEQYHHSDVVLAAQQLRKASRELGKLTGKINAEDILDVIFRDFCIGK